jgi:hypothetical protein
MSQSLLPLVGMKYVGLPPKKVSDFLWHVKDEQVPGIYSMPYATTDVSRAWTSPIAHGFCHTGH